MRAAEWMFIKTLERFAELARADSEPAGLSIAATMARGGEVSVDDYIRLHDVSLTIALDQWAGIDGPAARDPVLADLSRRLMTRHLFKTFDLGDDRAAAERLWPQALDVANKHFGIVGRFYTSWR